MFDSKITIIEGDRASGRTTFLTDILSTLISLNEELVFLDSLGESEIFSKIIDSDKLHYYKFPLIESNNLKLLNVLKEKINGMNINYLLIDDMDYSDISDIKSILYYIQSNNNCKLILTSSTGSNIDKLISGDNKNRILDFFVSKTKLDIKNYYVSFSYDDESINSKLKIDCDGVEYTREELKSLIFSKFREKRINSILREEENN
jgi:hypothetical protein